MEPVAKHYYRAVVWYYIGDEPQNAIADLYQVLESQAHHQAALFLARLAGQRQEFLKTAAIVEHNRFHDDVAQLLSFLNNGESDNFLITLLSYEQISDFVLRQIDWQPWLENFQQSAHLPHRIWSLLLQQNWQEALSLAQQLSKSARRNAVVCFQLGYVAFKMKNFMAAEEYLRTLLNFRDLYRLAAIRLWLQFSQRRFASLSDIPEAFIATTIREKLQIAVILQNSLDSKGFTTILRGLYRHVRSAGEYLQLAAIYIVDGQWQKAVNCLRRSHRLAPQNFNSLLQCVQPSLRTNSRNIKRFLWWWSKRLTRQPKNLQQLAIALQKQVPDVALYAYRQLQKIRGMQGELLLGEAITHFYLRNLTQAQQLLDAAQAKNSDLAGNIAAWQARITYEYGEYTSALNNLQANLKRFPDNELLQATLQQLANTSCPICNRPLQEYFCQRCNYLQRNMFACERQILRWHGNELDFPLGMLLVTTASLFYSCDQVIHVIAYASCNLRVQIKFAVQGATVSSHHRNFTPGINVWQEQGLSPAIYELQIVVDSGVVNRHYFLVGEPKASLRIDIESLAWQQYSLQLRLKLLDILQFPITEAVAVTAACPDIAWQISHNTVPENGAFEFSQPCAKKPLTLLLFVTTATGKTATAITAVDNFTDPADIRQLPCKEIAECCKIVHEYQQEITSYLPVKLSCSSVAQNVALRFGRYQQQVVVALQPLTEAPVQIHRFSDVDAEKRLQFPVHSPLMGLYLATTRFASTFHQQMGIEMSMLLCASDLELQISAETEIQPNTSIAVTVQVNRPVNGVLLMVPANSFQPLTSYFWQGALALIHRLQAPAVPILENNAALVCNPLVTATENRALTIQMIEVKKRNTFVISGSKQPGIFQIICLVSDQQFFAEKIFPIEVRNRQEICLTLPPVIQEDDIVESTMNCCALDKSVLTVRSQLRGLILEQTLAGQLRLPILCKSPDTFDISLGDLQHNLQIHASAHYAKIRSRFFCLDRGARWQQQNAIVYASHFTLAESLAQQLLDDNHRDYQTIAAQIYCAMRFYLLHLEKQHPHRVEFWEQHIQNLAEKLCAATTNFADGRWEYYAGYPQDPQITLEILHHLAPFLKLPRFQNLHYLAQKTLNAAISWKLRSNRLFFLALSLQERGIKNAEAAAGAIAHGYHGKKAWKYLRKHRLDQPFPHWHGNALGGATQTTALVCHAHYKANIDAWRDIASYFGHESANIVGNPPATVAFVDLLLALDNIPGEILPVHGVSIPLRDHRQINSPFTVEKGTIWCRVDDILPSEFVSSPVGKLKIKFRGPKPLRLGDEFTIDFKLDACKYPHLQLLVAANVAIIKNNRAIEGHYTWPEPQRMISLNCKAIRKGTAKFSFLVKNRYSDDIQIHYRYPISVE